MRDDVRALSTKLINIGVKGKQCAVIGKFSYDWVVTYFSILSADGVIAPLDRDWSEKDLSDTVCRANASFLFCDKDIEAKADYINSNNEFDHAPIIMMSEGEGSLNDLIEQGRS